MLPNSVANAKKYNLDVHKMPFSITRIFAERRSTPLQQINDLLLAQLVAARDDKEICFLTDGGWDHSPKNAETQLGFTFEHLRNERWYTIAVTRAAKLSAYNEVERLNGIETKSVQKSCLKDVVFLPSDEDLSGESAIAARRQHFQYVLAQSISGGVYAGQHVHSLVSHPGIEESETYDNEFRLYCRVILDGKQADVPIHARNTIANALHYRTLHHAQGYYHFQLRRTSCTRTLGKPCTPED